LRGVQSNCSDGRQDSGLDVARRVVCCQPSHGEFLCGQGAGYQGIGVPLKL
jgi:hypothetical protein